MDERAAGKRWTEKEARRALLLAIVAGAVAIGAATYVPGIAVAVVVVIAVAGAFVGGVLAMNGAPGGGAAPGLGSRVGSHSLVEIVPSRGGLAVIQ